MKCVLAFAFFSLMIPAVAAGQERVSFPSTDGDLKGGTPTTITGYLYKPTARVLLRLLLVCLGAMAYWTKKDKSNHGTDNGVKYCPVLDMSFFRLIHFVLADGIVCVVTLELDY